jgi:hypothetical protein
MQLDFLSENKGYMGTGLPAVGTIIKISGI